MMECENCVYFYCKNLNWGYCRRYPPTSIFDPNSDQHRWEFPMIDDPRGTRCGEFKLNG